MTSLLSEIVISKAREWIGTPYVHQASKKNAGTDCLGLIRGIYRELYGHEPEQPPPYTPDWNERHGGEVMLAAARRYLVVRNTSEPNPGDVVVFKIIPDGPPKHMGILSASDRFIHAYAGKSVSESWYSRWWRGRVIGVFSYPDFKPWVN